ncbi:MAG: hypothetical protein ACRD3M_11405 [Thermoanaerobaculia bacterium]
MRIAFRVSLVAAMLLGADAARGQFPGDVADNLRFRFGGIFANLDSTVTFSTPELPSGEIDVTGLLGDPDHKTTFRGEGFWNFAGRSFLDFGFVSFRTDNTRTISQDIEFGGVIYTAGAQVSSESLSRFLYAAYRYGFVKNPSFQLGLSLGISYTTLRGLLSASAGVTQPDGTLIGGTVTREAEINAPVPLIGLDVEGRIAKAFSLGARVRAFGASVNPYSGSMVEALAHVDWYFVRNAGLGAAYEWTRIDIDKEQESKTVGFIYRYDGPRIYLILTF